MPERAFRATPPPRERDRDRGPERPRERDRERERDRDRPRAAGGDRPEREGQDRFGRGRRNDRGPRRNDRREPPPLRNDPPPAEREFWEIWSEERTQADAGLAERVASEVAASGVRDTAGAPPADATPESTWGPLPGARESAPAESNENVARLYLNLGRKDGASERDIRDLIASHAGEVSISAVDVMNTHTYLNVAPADSDRVVAALSSREMGGRQIICEPAKPRRR
jgi:hypothetical protein